MERKEKFYLVGNIAEITGSNKKFGICYAIEPVTEDGETTMSYEGDAYELTEDMVKDLSDEIEIVSSLDIAIQDIKDMKLIICDGEVFDKLVTFTEMIIGGKK